MEGRYEPLKDLGAGHFGVARLVRDRKTKELVAVKYIQRGKKIDENVQREIINHRSLRHPNIIRFKEVALTQTHLAIVMEYAAGGELFERICNAGRFSEDEARYFFQQLISGVSYCHLMSLLLHSKPKSTVGTPAYIAPEVLSRKEYDGKIADVWSCGVTLYVMLVGAYPFEDPADPKNFRKTIGRIMNVQYSVPDYVHLSADCRQILSRIFVAEPSNRITIQEIKNHRWFLKSLPRELVEGEEKNFEDEDKNHPQQSIEEIMKIVEEARSSVQVANVSAGVDVNPDDLELDEEDLENSGDYTGAV